MKTDSLKLTIIVFVAVTAVQVMFMLIPLGSAGAYNLVVRPLVYAVLAVAVFVFLGTDGRPVPKAFESNVVAVISVTAFGGVILIMSFLFGAGTNAMAPNISIISRNLWTHGLPVILGEIIRYKLIKNANDKNRTFIIIALIVILAFGNMFGVRALLGGNIGAAVFYEVIFSPLVLSGVMSYFALTGSLWSVIMLSFAYAMTPYILPIIPNIQTIVWTLIVSGLLFLSAVVYRLITDEKNRALKAREKRWAKYAPKTIRGYIGYATTAGLIGVIAAFFAGVFPVYPLVVLTGSMAGTFEQGSLIFVHRVPQGETLEIVGEGEIIHFISRGRAYVHRVIAFTYSHSGERQYITQGDANDVADALPVSQHDVLGVVHASLPFLGYPYIFVRALFRRS